MKNLVGGGDSNAYSQNVTRGGCKVDCWPSRTCHVSVDRVFWASSNDEDEA